jgi:hypothetical protein
MEIIAIENICKEILCKGKVLYDSANKSSQYINEMESYISYMDQAKDKLYEMSNLINDFSNETLEKTNELKKINELKNKYKSDPYPILSIYKELYKTESWYDVTIKEEKANNIYNKVDSFINREYKYNPINYKKISNIDNVNLDFDLKIPIVNRLEEIPPSMYWFNGDSTHKKGIYTSISKKICIQIPLPNVVDGTKDFNRSCSIKCKNNTIEECYKIRKDLSSMYNSEIRNCNYAHNGEKYSKIGTTFRCPNTPRFGNHTYLNDDLNNTSENDIKILLMYSLSDILLSSMWFQKKKKKKLILNNINICN